MAYKEPPTTSRWGPSVFGPSPRPCAAAWPPKGSPSCSESWAWPRRPEPRAIVERAERSTLPFRPPLSAAARTSLTSTMTTKARRKKRKGRKSVRGAKEERGCAGVQWRCVCAMGRRGKKESEVSSLFLEESFTEVGPDNTYRRMLASYSTYCLQLLVEGNHRRKRLFADTREE